MQLITILIKLVVGQILYGYKHPQMILSFEKWIAKTLISKINFHTTIFRNGHFLPQDFDEPIFFVISIKMKSKFFKEFVYQ